MDSSRAHGGPMCGVAAQVSFDAQDEGVVAKILVEAGTEIKVQRDTRP